MLLVGLTKPGEMGEILALYRMKSLSLDYKAKLKSPCFFLQSTTPLLCPTLTIAHLFGTFVEKRIPKKIEKIQERALRFIYNEYTSSYEDLLCKSKLPSLKVRRLRTFALEVFKIVNKDCPVYLFDLIDIKKYFVFF